MQFFIPKIIRNTTFRLRKLINVYTHAQSVLVILEILYHSTHYNNIGTGEHH